jgi:hypothetical protein
MSEISEKGYIETVYASAKGLWGEEDAEKMCDHIEKTAGSVWRIGKLELNHGVEPVTKLRHGK